MTAANVVVREVGLRDGLQMVQRFFPTPAKLAWIAAELAAGVGHIEVCSFVPPKNIPQFADAFEVAEAAVRLPGLQASALVPNLKGAERAIAAGIRELHFVLSASEEHNLRNVRRTTQQSLDEFRAVVALAHGQEKKVAVSGAVATALGCTIAGPVDPGRVMAIARMLVEAGADELSLADTVGYANPAQVRALFERAESELGGTVPIAAHFHDTRGLGLANVYAAVEAGIRIFDASLAGLGGCPYAPGASGNIVTEDLVFLLESMGLRTGIDLGRLVEVRRIVAENLPDEAMYGQIAKAGPPKGFLARAA
ncbi:MAG: hydroxymethylglutaryl-CoA lyase [Alphaproteobacteria bacterium]|nr:hydroxymethylglutaryl-CoA lyase [Alphaproteobacteria bacterium]